MSDPKARRGVALGLRTLPLWIVAAAACGHVAWVFPSLPERVASHFDAGGVPDGWSSRATFAGAIVGVQLFLAVTFQLSAWGVCRLSPDLINMPNKDYWFEPSRRPETRGRIARALISLGIATQLFLVLLAHLSFRVSLGAATRLEGSLPLTLAYLVGVGLWTAWLCMGFRRPA